MNYSSSNLLNYKGWFLFLSLSLMACLMAYITINYVITINVYQASFADTLSSDRIDELININKQWAWISYFIIPILLIIKVSLVSITMVIGSIFFDIKLKFKKVFLIVTQKSQQKM